MKSKICKNCAYYSAYYQKWSDSFGKLNKGSCSKRNISQTQFETCENFRDNEQLEKMRYKRTMQSLERALSSINDIAQILKERESET